MTVEPAIKMHVAWQGPNEELIGLERCRTIYLSLIHSRILVKIKLPPTLPGDRVTLLPIIVDHLPQNSNMKLRSKTNQLLLTGKAIQNILLKAKSHSKRQSFIPMHRPHSLNELTHCKLLLTSAGGQLMASIVEEKSEEEIKQSLNPPVSDVAASKLALLEASQSILDIMEFKACLVYLSISSNCDPEIMRGEALKKALSAHIEQIEPSVVQQGATLFHLLKEQGSFEAEWQTLCVYFLGGREAVTAIFSKILNKIAAGHSPEESQEAMQLALKAFTDELIDYPNLMHTQYDLTKPKNEN